MTLNQQNTTKLLINLFFATIDIILPFFYPISLYSKFSYIVLALIFLIFSYFEIKESYNFKNSYFVKLIIFLLNFILVFITIKNPFLETVILLMVIIFINLIKIKLNTKILFSLLCIILFVPTFINSNYSIKDKFLVTFSFLFFGVAFLFYLFYLNIKFKIFYNKIEDYQLVINEQQQNHFKIIEKITNLAISKFKLKKQQKLIQLAEYTLQNILENIANGFIILDLNYNLKYVNEAFIKIIDCDDEKILLGKNFLEFIDEKDKELVIKKLNLAQKNIKSDFEITLKTKKEKKFVNITLSNYFQLEKQNIGFLIIVKDITKNKIYEQQIQQKNDELQTLIEELRQTNEELLAKQNQLEEVNLRLYTIFENIIIGIALYNLENQKITYLNKAGFHTLEIEELEDLNTANLQIDQIKENEIFETDYVTKTNHTKKLLILKTDIELSGKKHFLINFLDITKLSEAQKTILQQKKLQETLINNLPDFIYIKDKELRYILVNKALAEDFGLSPQEILGRRVNEFVNESLANFYNSLDLFVFKEKKPIYNIEQKFISNTGKEKWTLVNKIPLFDENQEVYAVIGISRDITEQKNKEKLLIEKNKQFENTLNHLSDIYFKTDIDGNLIYISPSIKRHTGYDAQSNVLKNTIKKIILEQKNNLLHGELNEEIYFSNIEVKLLTEDKNIFYGIANFNIWFDNQNMPAGFEGIITNTTEIIKLKKELENKNKILEVSVKILNEQKENLEKLLNNINENILYAKTIQNSLLPSEILFEKYFKEFFIIYKPRDIVSGDFYYLFRKKNITYIAVGDCTGHGVTGAFLTIMSISYLNMIIFEIDILETSNILNKLRSLIVNTFCQSGNFNNNGLDLALIRIDTEKRIIQFSGALIDLYYYMNKKLEKIKAQRIPVGLFFNKEEEFNEFNLYYTPDTTLYIFTDGYIDQFTDQNVKLPKLGIKRLKSFLNNIANFDLKTQKELLLDFLEKWQGSETQTDDITFLGIKL